MMANEPTFLTTPIARFGLFDFSSSSGMIGKSRGIPLKPVSFRPWYGFMPFSAIVSPYMLTMRFEKMDA